jgi:predicted lipid-binding transport protein (Tim44 family)
MTLALSSAAEAFARAGGGNSYGGGGGGGGGSGGGGSGLFSLWPLLFVGHGSGAGVIVALIILYYLYQRMQASRGGSSSSDVQEQTVTPQFMNAPSRVVDEQAIASGIATIQARDPQFSAQAFLDRAQAAFFKIQQAWAARNQDLARDVMSDALYERHKMQTDQLIANHRIDVLENIVIGHAKIVSVTPAAPFDSICIAFTASMTDYTIDENTKQIVDGQRVPTTFTEFWTFIRRADAHSTAGATTLASTCPSCGAPLKLTNGRCDFCSAPVRTSSSEWVVDQIEQAF